MTADLVAEARALLDAREGRHDYYATIAWDEWILRNARALLDRCEALQKDGPVLMDYATNGRGEPVPMTMRQALKASMMAAHAEGQYANELKAERDALQRERDEAQDESLQQARLLGMGGERELALIAERDALQRKLDDLNAVPHPSPQGTP